VSASFPFLTNIFTWSSYFWKLLLFTH